MADLLNPNRIRHAHYQRLLAGKTVQSWLHNRHSPSTRRQVAAKIAFVCDRYSLSPSELARRNERDVTRILVELRNDVISRGKGASYFKNMYGAVKSWREYNGRSTPDIVVPQVPKRYADEPLMSPLQLASAIVGANSKARAIVGFLAFAGVLPGVLGSIDGRDGLELRDMPELNVKNTGVTFVRTPSTVVVRPELSRSKNRYLTFLSVEGCDLVKNYISSRVTLGEELKPSSAVITVDFDKKQKHGSHVSTQTITEITRKAFRRANLQARPNSLRRFFSMRLQAGEIEGLMHRASREFLLGHIHPTSGNPIFLQGADAIEMIRREYQLTAERFMTTRNVAPSIGPQVMRKRIWEAMEELNRIRGEISSGRMSAKAKDLASLAQLLAKSYRLSDLG